MINTPVFNFPLVLSYPGYYNKELHHNQIVVVSGRQKDYMRIKTDLAAEMRKKIYIRSVGKDQLEDLLLKLHLSK